MMMAATVKSSAPVNTVAPAVTGTASIGSTLSCSTGTWTGDATINYTYQWQHVTTNISGATSSTYVISYLYYNETIRCVVTGTNGVGNSSANSNATSAVAFAAYNETYTAGTYTVSKTGASTVTIECYGAGANGTAGGGGGGGAYAIKSSYSVASITNVYLNVPSSAATNSYVKTENDSGTIIASAQSGQGGNGGCYIGGAACVGDTTRFGGTGGGANGETSGGGGGCAGSTTNGGGGGGVGPPGGGGSAGGGLAGSGGAGNAAGSAAGGGGGGGVSGGFAGAAGRIKLSWA